MKSKRERMVERMRRYVGRAVWINHSCNGRMGEPWRCKLVGIRPEPTDWPFRVQINGRGWCAWGNAYPSRRSAITAAAAEAKDWRKRWAKT